MIKEGYNILKYHCLLHKNQMEKLNAFIKEEEQHGHLNADYKDIAYDMYDSVYPYNCKLYGSCY